MARILDPTLYSLTRCLLDSSHGQVASSQGPDSFGHAGVRRRLPRRTDRIVRPADQAAPVGSARAASRRAQGLREGAVCAIETRPKAFLGHERAHNSVESSRQQRNVTFVFLVDRRFLFHVAFGPQIEDLIIESNIDSMMQGFTESNDVSRYPPNFVLLRNLSGSVQCWLPVLLFPVPVLIPNPRTVPDAHVQAAPQAATRPLQGPAQGSLRCTSIFS